MLFRRAPDDSLRAGLGECLEGMGCSYRHRLWSSIARRRAAQLAVLKPEICAERG